MKELLELLELAAKAMGLHHSVEDGGWVFSDGTFYGTCWNPHTDDGDCARMEAHLGIDVMWGTSYVSLESVMYGPAVIENYADHNGDRQAARRMASLRAAAEIGRGMNK